MTGHLFVLGLGRSGTTALTRVLGAHRQVVLGIERYKRLWAHNETVGGLTPDLFTRDRFFDFSDGLTNLTPDKPRYTDWYAAADAKFDSAAYVGDKLTNLQPLPYLVETFPGCRLVVIVRDVAQVAASWQVRADNPNDTWSSARGAAPAVQQWNRGLAVVEQVQEEAGAQVLVVDYGDFFYAGSDRPLTRVLTFLGLESDDGVAAAFASAVDHAGGIADKDRSLPEDIQAVIAAQADTARYERLTGGA